MVIFCVATYGEGEPTDNAVALMDFLRSDDIAFSNGGNTLENLNYVVFAREYYAMPECSAPWLVLDSPTAFRPLCG